MADRRRRRPGPTPPSGPGKPAAAPIPEPGVYFVQLSVADRVIINNVDQGYRWSLPTPWQPILVVDGSGYYYTFGDDNMNSWEEPDKVVVEVSERMKPTRRT